MSSIEGRADAYVFAFDLDRDWIRTYCGTGFGQSRFDLLCARRPWLARRDVVLFHLGPIRPLQDRLAGEIAVIVAVDHLRLPCPSIIRSISRATRRPESDVSTTSARHSLTQSSTTVSTRNLRRTAYAFPQPEKASEEMNITHQRYRTLLRQIISANQESNLEAVV